MYKGTCNQKEACIKEQQNALEIQWSILTKEVVQFELQFRKLNPASSIYIRQSLYRYGLDL